MTDRWVIRINMDDDTEFKCITLSGVATDKPIGWIKQFMDDMGYTEGFHYRFWRDDGGNRHKDGNGIKRHH